MTKIIKVSSGVKVTHVPMGEKKAENKMKATQDSMKMERTYEKNQDKRAKANGTYSPAKERAEQNSPNLVESPMRSYVEYKGKYKDRHTNN